MLQAPHDYRSSMVSLSDQSAVPSPVHLGKHLHSQTVKRWNAQSVPNSLEMNASQARILPLSPQGCPIAKRNRRSSQGSDCTSSVYSELSTITPSTRGRNQEISSGPETQANSPSAIDARPASAHDTAVQDIDPGEARRSPKLPDVLSPRPLQLFQSTSINLTRTSLANQPETFLLDDSSSESKQSSPLCTRHSGGSVNITKEKQYKTSSEFASGSFENISEAGRVRTRATSLHMRIDS